MVTGLLWEPDESHGVYSGQSVAATPCRLPRRQAVARNVTKRWAAGGSRSEELVFARIDPPEFFSAPATPFLASRNAATYEDSIILGVPAETRDPKQGPLLREPFGFIGVING